jgi:hypothetical protein
MQPGGWKKSINVWVLIFCLRKFVFTVRISWVVPSKMVSLESGDLSHTFLHTYIVLNINLVKHFLSTIIYTALCDRKSILEISVLFLRTALCNYCWSGNISLLLNMTFFVKRNFVLRISHTLLPEIIWLADHYEVCWSITYAPSSFSLVVRGYRPRGIPVKIHSWGVCICELSSEHTELESLLLLQNSHVLEVIYNRAMLPLQIPPNTIS